jgi:hypothetical protein
MKGAVMDMTKTIGRFPRDLAEKLIKLLPHEWPGLELSLEKNPANPQLPNLVIANGNRVTTNSMNAIRKACAVAYALHGI